MKSVKLGNKYKDTLHGIEGVATAITSYLTGCDQVCLEYKKDNDVISFWFDITRLADVELAEKDRKPGGPQKHAPNKSRA